jgi:hypothetical protein
MRHIFRPSLSMRNCSSVYGFACQCLYACAKSLSSGIDSQVLQGSIYPSHFTRCITFLQPHAQKQRSFIFSIEYRFLEALGAIFNYGLTSDRKKGRIYRVELEDSTYQRLRLPFVLVWHLYVCELETSALVACLLDLRFFSLFLRVI